MKTERKFPKFTVSKKAEASLRAGHPWIYDTEITDISGDTPNGCLADAVSSKGTYLGTGLYSEKSKIRLRILAANANEAFGEAFFGTPTALRCRIPEKRSWEKISPAAGSSSEKRTACPALR